MVNAGRISITIIITLFGSGLLLNGCHGDSTSESTRLTVDLGAEFSDAPLRAEPGHTARRVSQIDVSPLARGLSGPVQFGLPLERLNVVVASGLDDKRPEVTISLHLTTTGELVGRFHARLDRLGRPAELSNDLVVTGGSAAELMISQPFGLETRIDATMAVDVLLQDLEMFVGVGNQPLKGGSFNGNDNGGNTNENAGNSNDNGGNANDNGGDNANDNSDGVCSNGVFSVEGEIDDLIEAEYRVFGADCARFRLDIEEFPQGWYDVAIEGVYIGGVYADSDGDGRLRLETDDGSFPEDFPFVEVGDVVTVGGTVGVALQPDCPESLDCANINGNDNGS